MSKYKIFFSLMFFYSTLSASSDSQHRLNGSRKVISFIECTLSDGTIISPIPHHYFWAINNRQASEDFIQKVTKKKSVSVDDKPSQAKTTSLKRKYKKIFTFNDIVKKEKTSNGGRYYLYYCPVCDHKMQKTTFISHFRNKHKDKNLNDYITYTS